MPTAKEQVDMCLNLTGTKNNTGKKGYWRKKYFYTIFFLLSVFLERDEILSNKKVMNFPRTYKKLHCKGKPNRSGGYRYPSLHTDCNHLTFML